MFFCRMMNVTSLFFECTSFPVVCCNCNSLLPLAILFMTQFFIFSRMPLPLSFSSYFLLLLLLESLMSSNFLLRHSGTSPSTVLCLSRPPPLLLMSSDPFASLSMSLLRFLLCVGDSASGFKWFFLHSSWIPCAENFF